MKQFIVDAFTERVFGGNPAAVCLAERWPSEEAMKRIAMENRLSETAFVVPEERGYGLRWFTLETEIDFCGHATLASAYVLFSLLCPEAREITFFTKTGALTVKRRREEIEMLFPAYHCRPVAVSEAMTAALGVRPLEAYLDRDLLLVFEDEAAVRRLCPDGERLCRLPGLLAIATAPGNEWDCVSRVFGPKVGIPEDPVTGSAHCMIAPYFGERLGKTALRAYQASPRGGSLRIELSGDTVAIFGRAALFATGKILEEGMGDDGI